MKTTMQKGNDNPFFQKKALNQLLLSGSKASSKQALVTLLDNAWDECYTSKHNTIKVLRQMFFILIFELGDISNRSHSIFKGKSKDSGGKAARAQFMWAMEWMRKNTFKQYYKFLMKDLFRQFVGILSILAVGVKTQKKKTDIIEIVNTIADHDKVTLAKYIAKILRKANPVEKILIFKALTRVRVSKRQKMNRVKEKIGFRPLQEETLQNMRIKEEFYALLSDEMGWEYLEYPNNIKFVGMNAEKAKYTGSLESVLFASKKIVEFDQDEFFNWLNTLPAGARRRVRVRLLTKDNQLKGKWIAKKANVDFGTWFLAWENFKEQKQQEERELVQKARTRGLTEQETVKLEQVKKEAKVNVGATSLMDELEKLMFGTPDDTLVHSVLNKIDFDVEATFIVDRSFSMAGNWGHAVVIGNKTAPPYRIAQLLATLGMLKMPKSDNDDILITFGTNAQVHSVNSIGTVKENKFMSGHKENVANIIDRTKSFSWNFNNLGKLCVPNQGGTRFDGVAIAIKNWTDAGESEAEKQVRIELVQAQQLFIVISDGDMNNVGSPKASMLDFLAKMKHWFGWGGAVLVWDTGTSNEKTASKFADIPNVFHKFGWNIGAINTMFKQIHDLDVLDIYSDLHSLYKSDRYDKVKENTL